jgi:hypothetical protein
MRPTKARFQLWQVMLAVAVLAGLFAAFGLTGAVANVILIGVISLPILFARPGHRLRAAAWVACLYPLLSLASLYTTWSVARLVLGRTPDPWFDDHPRLIDPFVEALYLCSRFSLLTLPFSPLLSIPLAIAYIAQRDILRRRLPTWRAAGLVLAPILVWFSVLAFVSHRLLGTDAILIWYRY